MRGQSRWQLKDVCFTLFYDSPAELADFRIKLNEFYVDCCTYLCYGLEVASSSQRTHIQGYFEMKSRKRVPQIKILMRCPTVHIEKRMGTRSEARDYCRKECVGDRVNDFVELGVWSVKVGEQGKRTDLEEAWLDLKRKREIDEDFIDHHPSVFLQYYKGLEAGLTVLAGGSKRRSVKCLAICGETGCGKTSLVYDAIPAKHIFRLSPEERQKLWFDGYTHQKVLFIDEFRGALHVPSSKLNEICDGYPLRKEKKGGFVEAHWNFVIVISNIRFDGWYASEDAEIQAAVRRRFIIHQVPSGVTLHKYGESDWEDLPETVRDFFAAVRADCE